MLLLKDHIWSIQILDYCTTDNFYWISFGLKQKLIWAIFKIFLLIEVISFERLMVMHKNIAIPIGIKIYFWQ